MIPLTLSPSTVILNSLNLVSHYLILLKYKSSIEKNVDSFSNTCDAQTRWLKQTHNLLIPPVYSFFRCNYIKVLLHYLKLQGFLHMENLKSMISRLYLGRVKHKFRLFTISALDNRVDPIHCYNLPEENYEILNYTNNI